MGSIALNSAVPATTSFKNLQLGWPSPRLCQQAGLQEASQAVLAGDSDMSKVLLYGPHKGSKGYRHSVAEWLTETYAPRAGPVDPDSLCVTSGASQNLANIAMKFADPSYTRCIFMVEPTYFLACPILEDVGFQNRLKGVPETVDDGIDLPFLEHEIHLLEQSRQKELHATAAADVPSMKTGAGYPHIYKYLIYVNPTFSNPSGKTMSISLREALVAFARRHDALVISDDVYDALIFPEDPSAGIGREDVQPPPRLVDVDRAMPGRSDFGNTVSNGSFSKIIGPGFRVGWAEGTSEFVNHLGNCGSSSSGGAPSHFASTLVDRMLHTGSLQAYIRDVLVPTYRERYYALMDAIRRNLIPHGVVIASETQGAQSIIPGMAGGYFTYLRLPSDMPPAKTIAAVALHEQEVRIAFGDLFTVYGDPSSTERAHAASDTAFGRCIRLCWAWHEAADIVEAIARIGRLLGQVREKMQKGEEIGTGLDIGLR